MRKRYLDALARQTEPDASTHEMIRRVGDRLIRLYKSGGPADQVAKLEAELTELSGDDKMPGALREFALRTEDACRIDDGDGAVLLFKKDEDDGKQTKQ